MHPEPEEVDHRRDQDEADGAGGKVAVELFLSGLTITVSVRTGRADVSDHELTIVRPRLTSRRFQRSTATAVPTDKNANRPTILHEIVNERKTPVKVIQVHQGRVNSLLKMTYGSVLLFVRARERGLGKKTAHE